MPARASNKKILLTALILSLVCSALVTITTTLLRPVQEENRLHYKQQNILKAAGLWQPGVPLSQQTQQLEAHLIDLEVDWFAEREDIQADQYDHFKASDDPSQSIALTAEQDLAGIKRRANYAPVYLIRDETGKVDRIVLPIYGYGLWSTLFGFIALDRDMNSVVGLSFYEHADTPGLGGEIENPQWLQQWPGKKIYDDNYQPVIELVRGRVAADSYNAIHQVDGLSGATLTARGVQGLLRFWLGEDGFGPFLYRMRFVVEEL